MKSFLIQKRRLVFVILASVLASLFVGIMIWLQIKIKANQVIEMQRLLESNEGVLITKTVINEQPNFSPKIDQQLSEFKIAISNSYSPMRIFSNNDENEIVMIRLSWQSSALDMASRILDNQERFYNLLTEEAKLRQQMKPVFERIIYRLKNRTTDAFQDEAYRLSLSRAESLWQDRTGLIELSDNWNQTDSTAKRYTELKTQITDLQNQLMKIPFEETDKRVVLGKKLKSLKAELSQISFKLSDGAEAINLLPLVRLQINQKELFTIAATIDQEKKQINAIEKLLPSLNESLSVTAKQDLQNSSENSIREIEIRRRSILNNLNK